MKRLALLDEDAAQHVRIFSSAHSPALEKIAGDRLTYGLPDSADIEAASVVLVAGLPRQPAEKIAQTARALGRLVNVEDVNDLCDFYFTANIRRGELLIAVSTSGASPTLARKIRDRIAKDFGPEWAGRVRELSDMRLSLKAKGASMRELIDAAEAYLRDKGWLGDKVSPDKDEAA